MANSEHLAKLMEGVEEWNAWREKNPGIIADLDEAPFWQINHKGANLRESGSTGGRSQGSQPQGG